LSRKAPETRALQNETLASPQLSANRRKRLCDHRRRWLGPLIQRVRFPGAGPSLGRPRDLDSHNWRREEPLLVSPVTDQQWDSRLRTERKPRTALNCEQGQLEPGWAGTRLGWNQVQLRRLARTAFRVASIVNASVSFGMLVTNGPISQPSPAGIFRVSETTSLCT